jgi:outer membrane protein assembly factor BamE (lipoprotein component of BamABCDE complex)
MPRLIALVVLVLWGCKTPAPASETLPRLRDAIASPVATEEDNQRNSALVQQVSEDGVLQGLTRQEVQDQIGRGDVCSRHPMCREKGFEDDDWYYEVGQMGEAIVRVRPVLIVGFDRFGKVTHTYNLRVK